MARLRINDGYTLTGATTEKVVNPVTGATIVEGLPIVRFTYRPALPDAINEWRYLYNRAASGKEQVTATARLVADHLVSWDVVGDDAGNVAPIEVDTVRVVPDPILNQLSDTIQTWAPKAGEDAGK